MTPENKQPERDAIAEAVAAFKKKGGKVTKVGVFATAVARGPYSTHERRIMRDMLDQGYCAADIGEALGRTTLSVMMRIAMVMRARGLDK